MKWKKEEIELLKQPLTSFQVAQRLGRTPKSVDNARTRLGIRVEHRGEAPPTTVHEDLKAQDESFWQRQHETLKKKYDEVLKRATEVDRLVASVLEMAPRSYNPAPKVVEGEKRNHGLPQSAVLELSDTHIGAVVEEGQTLTFGHYNFPIFLARLKTLETSIISIAKNHITTPVPELVVAMLGDMLDGALQHSNECGQVNPLFNQFFGGAHALAQFLRNLAGQFPVVRVYDAVGNHTRYHNQKKMPTKNKHSNYDKFLYAMIRALVRDVPNISWEFNAQPFQVFDVQGFQCFAGHGEHLRGGDKALGIPSHSIGRTVSTATQLFNKYERRAPNYYLFGHLHRNISLPHATGDVIINGGFVGVDGFGLSEMFTPADPMQKLFFMHPKYGKTATYDISLKFAQVGPKAPYSVPGEFGLN